jgi:hypothetical protein
MNTLSKKQRKAILKSADAKYIRIRIIPGIALAPKETGESWYYTTRGGARILHPSAYSKRGFSNMVYHASTRRIEVGQQWVDHVS